MRLHDSPTTSLADHRARAGHYRNVVLSLSFIRTILVIQIPCSLVPRPDAASSPSLGKKAIDFEALSGKERVLEALGTCSGTGRDEEP